MKILVCDSPMLLFGLGFLASLADKSEKDVILVDSLDKVKPEARESLESRLAGSVARSISTFESELMDLRYEMTYPIVVKPQLRERTVIPPNYKTRERWKLK
jgi:hypothetical protein